MNKLIIPEEWKYNEQTDCQYAYEAGYYDGRDEALDSLEYINTNNIAEWLTKAIKEYGHQGTLSEKSFISPQTFTKWKHDGSMPRFDLLDAACSVMGYEICIRKKDE